MLRNISEKHLATLKAVCVYLLSTTKVAFLPECDSCSVSAELCDTETEALND